jgi:transcriptional regulator with XRE-family HTH domain
MSINKTLGDQIRKRRHEIRLSLRAVARQANVSASFLSQVERGQASPSLNTLRSIAEALDVPLFYFLLSQASNEHVVRAGQGVRLELPGSKIDYELRSPSPARKILAFVGSMQPDSADKAASPRQSTQETIYVLQGRLTIELVDGMYQLEPGDSITFDGLDLVCLINEHEGETQYLSFITPPVF